MEGGTPCRRCCKSLRPFLDDLFNAHLACVKAVVFCVMFGVVVIWPQMSLHQLSLNLTSEDVGYLSACNYLVVFVAPLLSGLVADKIGNFKVFMSIITVLTGVLTFVFLAIPAAVQVPYAGENTTSTNATSTSIAINSSFTDEDESSKTTLVNDPRSHAVTFYTYMAIRLAYGFLQASSYTLVDSTVLVYQKELGVNYGFQRAWGTLAALVSSVVGGYLVQDGQDFRPIFIVGGLMQLLASALILKVHNLDMRTSAARLTSDVWSVVRKSDTLVFLFIMICIGVFFGFTETFMYIYLKDIGASNFLISLTVTAGAPLELLLQLTSASIVGVMGYVPVICFCSAGYVVRFVGFRFMTDPMMVFPLEVVDSLTSGLLSTAAAMYCAELASPSTVASLRGLYGALMSGVGRTLGAVFGNQLRQYFGPRESWGILAVAALILSLSYTIYYIVTVFYRKHHHTLSINKSAHDPTATVITGDLRSAAASKGMVNEGFERGN